MGPQTSSAPPSRTRSARICCCPSTSTRRRLPSPTASRRTTTAPGIQLDDRRAAGRPCATGAGRPYPDARCPCARQDLDLAQDDSHAGRPSRGRLPEFAGRPQPRSSTPRSETRLLKVCSWRCSGCTCRKPTIRRPAHCVSRPSPPDAYRQSAVSAGVLGGPSQCRADVRPADARRTGHADSAHLCHHNCCEDATPVGAHRPGRCAARS